MYLNGSLTNHKEINITLRLQKQISMQDDEGNLNYEVTKKYPLRGHILGVLMHTIAQDWHWGGDETLEWVLVYVENENLW